MLCVAGFKTWMELRISQQELDIIGDPRSEADSVGDFSDYGDSVDD